MADLRSRVSRLLGLFFLLLAMGHPRAQAATPLTRVLMTTGAFSEREGVVFVAQDQGFFRKYGLDVRFVHVRSGPVGMAALSAGESQFHVGSVGRHPRRHRGRIGRGLCRRTHQQTDRHVHGEYQDQESCRPQRENARCQQHERWQLDICYAGAGSLGTGTETRRDHDKSCRQ